MKTVLVNLAKAENPFGLLYHFPIGLLNVAQVIKDQGVECAIIDVPWLDKQGEFKERDFRDVVVEKIVTSNPAAVGFYTRCDILPTVLFVAENLKKVLPDIKIILGGPGATFVAQEILKSMPFIDIIFKGESEETLREVFVDGKINDKLDGIAGLAFRKGKEVVVCSERSLIEDLDTLPMPAFDMISYYREDESFASIEAGRGCPYNCSFCSTSAFWKKKYRTKSPGRIVKEIQDTIKLFGGTTIALIHDNLLVSKKFTKELTNEIKEKLPGVKWKCSGRVDNLDNAMVKDLKESGCISVFLGIESGSQKMQKQIGKDLDLVKVEKVLEEFESVGLKAWTSFIIGFPGEEIEDINETIKLAIRTRQYTSVELAQVHFLSPDPGSQLFESNKNILKFSEKFSGHSTSAFIMNETEINYIKRFPNIFSSFYEVNKTEKDLKNLAEMALCCKIMLNLYPRTLEVLVTGLGIGPYDLFNKILDACPYRDECKGFTKAPSNTAICRKFYSFFKEVIEKLPVPLYEVVRFEETCVELLSKEYEIPSGPKNLELNKNFIPAFSSMVTTFYSKYKVDDILKNLIKGRDFSGTEEELWRIVIRKTQGAINVIDVNKEVSEIVGLIDGIRSYEEIIKLSPYDQEFVDSVFIKMNEFGLLD